MKNITLEYYFLQLSSMYPQERKKAISYLNTLISNYRLMATKSRGYVRDYCYKEADYLEFRLRETVHSND
jgi:hypothetical protein